MRRIHLTVMVVAALVTFVAGSAITARPRGTPSTAPLHPLSQRDLNATRHLGCECTFRVGRNTLFQMIGDELTIRTRGGRQVCRITDQQFSALTNGHGAAVCAGLRLSLRRTGPIRSSPATESADWPASLSLSEGRMQRTLSGRWGCAC